MIRHVNSMSKHTLRHKTEQRACFTHLPGKAGLSNGLEEPISSSGRGGGGGSVDGSILRSRARDLPLFDLDCFPIVT